MTFDWRPTADPAALNERALLKRRIRDWFHGAGFLEVDTPVLVAAPVTDPATGSIAVPLTEGALAAGPLAYLATSPEYAMKRLLAAGSGNIYQFGPVFRADEHGRQHRTEFTLLEWYRVDQDLDGLMRETEALLMALDFPDARRISYQAAFETAVGLDPLTAPDEVLLRLAQSLAEGLDIDSDDRPMLLDLIFSLAVAPTLGNDGVPVLLHRFPSCQAALARSDPTDPRVAMRVEVFVGGVEMGNGFEELTDADEQRTRFCADNRVRMRRGLAQQPIDERLLAALESGLPACAGMAMGLERLHMARYGHQDIREVVAFADEFSGVDSAPCDNPSFGNIDKLRGH